MSKPGLGLEEALGLEWLFRLRGPIAAPQEAVIVAIDEASAAAFGQPRKLRDWDRGLHAELVERLVEQGVSVIVFDIFFEAQRDADPGFAAALSRAQRVVLAQSVRRQQVGGWLLESVANPTPALAQASRGLASFPLPKVPNRVSQFWLFVDVTGFHPTLPLAAFHLHVQRTLGEQRLRALLSPGGLASAAAAQPGSALRREILDYRERLRRAPPELEKLALSDDERGLLTALLAAYRPPDSRFLNYYGPPRATRTLSYRALWDDADLDLAGKVVFVGGMELNPEQLDGFHTVFSGLDGVDLSGVEIAATAFANLLAGDGLRQPAMLAQLALLAGLGILFGLLAALPGAYAVAAGLSAGVLYWGLAQWSFSDHRLWLPLLTPLAVQLPLALLAGLLGQYLRTRREEQNVSQALRYHMPEAVAKRFRESADPITPERVYATCLLSDIQGYTTLSERFAPQDLVRLSNEYFALLGERVKAGQGEMLEIMGDGMTCVWPSPNPEREMRLAACRTALEVQQAVAEFNARHPQIPFPTRIGLHAGWVAMGHMGGSGHYIYGVAGDIVNTASRIEGLNKYVGTRLLAEQRVVEGLDELLLRPLGRFQLKGKTEVLSVVEILGQRDRSDGLERLCQQFTAALALYQAGAWAQAGAAFQALCNDYPADGPSRFYVERCVRLKSAAAAESTIRLQEK